MPNKGSHKQYFRNAMVSAALLLFAGGMLQGCGERDAKVEEKVKYSIPDSLISRLAIDTVRRCQLTNALSLTGMIDFDQDKQVPIYSLVSGNVENVTVQLGDYVTAGEVLAVVKSSEVAGYGNSLVIAETNVTATKKQLDAANDLFKAGLASSLDVTNAQVNYDQAVSQLETAKRVLKINGNNTKGEFVIKAPINGFVVQKTVTNNTTVRADNGTALFTISDLKDVWVQANVYEANIEKVHIGDSVQVKILSEPDRVFHGKIDKILNVLDPTSKVVKVRVILENPGYILKPAMYASVLVTNSEGKAALCVPSKSLVYETSRYYVLVYHGSGKADIAPVEVINTVGDKAYLKSGVNEGDLVVGSMALQIYSELNN